jgi:hypothetical protein
MRVKAAVAIEIDGHRSPFVTSVRAIPGRDLLWLLGACERQTEAAHISVRL